VTHPEHAERPERLSIEHRVVDGVRVVTLRGEIDHDVRAKLSTALLSQGEPVPARIVADLSGVTFMDSSGLNVFVAAHRQARTSEGWVRIAGAQESVLRVLQMTEVDSIISCYPTLERALTA